MKKILAFGASSSTSSINKKLASWAANQLENVAIQIIDLNDYEMPIYSIDKENEAGIHQLAVQFKSEIEAADFVIISFAEHNGGFTAAYKNIIDWVSRISSGIWSDKNVFLLATSPGQRGGQGVLGAALNSMPHQKAKIIGSFSLPSFNKNFQEDKGILDQALHAQFNQEFAKLKVMLE